MSFFPTGKNAKTTLQAKPLAIRKEVRTVIVSKPKPKVVYPIAAAGQSNRACVLDDHGAKKTARHAASTQPRISNGSEGKKRSPPSSVRPVFDSSSDSSSGEDVDEVASRKRKRLSITDACPRQIRDRATWNLNACDGFTFIHGAALTTGDYTKDFVPAFKLDEAAILELQYPSRSPRERYACHIVVNL